MLRGGGVRNGLLGNCSRRKFLKSDYCVAFKRGVGDWVIPGSMEWPGLGLGLGHGLAGLLHKRVVFALTEQVVA